MCQNGAGHTDDKTGKMCKLCGPLGGCLRSDVTDESGPFFKCSVPTCHVRCHKNCRLVQTYRYFCTFHIVHSNRRCYKCDKNEKHDKLPFYCEGCIVVAQHFTCSGLDEEPELYVCYLCQREVKASSEQELKEVELERNKIMRRHAVYTQEIERKLQLVKIFFSVNVDKIKDADVLSYFEMLREVALFYDTDVYDLATYEISSVKDVISLKGITRSQKTEDDFDTTVLI